MLKRAIRLKPAIRTLAIAALLAAAACTPVYKNHGYIPPAEDLAQIKVGVDTRDTVTETIGALPGVLTTSARKNLGLETLRAALASYALPKN